MDKFKNNLNTIGLTLILAAVVGIRIWPYKKIIPAVLAVLGIAALGVYIAMNLSSLKKGFKRKSFLYSSNLLLVVVLVLAIVVLLNVILARNRSVLVRWRNHELRHVRQYECYGPFFLPVYFALAAYTRLRGRHPGRRA